VAISWIYQTIGFTFERVDSASDRLTLWTTEVKKGFLHIAADCTKYCTGTLFFRFCDRHCQLFVCSVLRVKCHTVVLSTDDIGSYSNPMIREK